MQDVVHSSAHDLRSCPRHPCRLQRQHPCRQGQGHLGALQASQQVRQQDFSAGSVSATGGARGWRWPATAGGGVQDTGHESRHGAPCRWRQGEAGLQRCQGLLQ